MEPCRSLGAGEVTCTEQTSTDWLTLAFSVRAKHRNLVKSWFADVGLSMSDSMVDPSGCFNKCYEKSWEIFTQRNTIIQFTFLKDHFDHPLKNR